MTGRDGGPGAWQRVRARPVLFGGVAAASAAGVAFVLVWFQPQALLFDTVVDEDFPAVEPAEAAAQDDDPEEAATPEPTPSPTQEPADGPRPDAPPAGDDRDGAGEAPADPDGAAATDETAAEGGPQALATGTFASRNRYTVEGSATVYEVEGGARVLRLEDFESTNGPDLFVYLTAADEADSDAALDEDFVNLGELRGNIGGQNYDIPDDVDLDRYDTVVIWCRRFTVGFGAADLAPAG